MERQPNELTDSSFWDAYWADIGLPEKVDQSFSFDRCLSSELARIVSEQRPSAAIELGAAPGKWLHFFSGLGLEVAGIDSSPHGFEVLTSNLRLLSIDDADLRFGTAADIVPDRSFDLVASFGLIEHFEQPMEILEHHVKWLAAGGTLVIGVPNFTGLHGLIQRWLDQSVFETHNTATMSREFFETTSKKLGLALTRVAWIGSFEPTLPMINEQTRTSRKWRVTRFPLRVVLWAARRLRRLRMLDGLNHPWLSSYIVAVMTKP